MEFETKEEITEKIKNYDIKRLLNSFVYISNLKCNLLDLIKTPVFDSKNAQELLEYFMAIEDCIADRLFGDKNV